MNEIEFKVEYRGEEVSGYMLEEEADDEHPLRFYSSTGGEQWYIPENPYKNSYSEEQLERKNHYDILTKIIYECFLFTQYLVDFQDKQNQKIILDEVNGYDVVLTVN